MFRALSTRRSNHGYERLVVADESTVSRLEGKLKRAASVPSGVFNPSRKLKPAPEDQFITRDYSQPQVKKSTKKLDKIHPIFSLRNSRSKKKATANPGFARYLEYFREGGMTMAQ